MPLSLPGGEDAVSFDFDQFGSINTKSSRLAIQDQEFAFVQNFFPIGAGNLRTMYGEGLTLYHAGGDLFIVYMYPYNIGANQYMFICTSNGFGFQVAIPGGAVTTISETTGIFYNTSVSPNTPQCVQWESKYLVIAATSQSSGNAYYIWDGTNLFSPGSYSPDIEITNSGSGLVGPITIESYGGSGATGAVGTGTVQNGMLVSAKITNPSAGFLPTDKVQAYVVDGGGGPSGPAATASISASSGGVGEIDVLNGGTGYTTSSVVTLSGGGFTTAAQAVITGLNNGTITQISIVNPGNGYTSPPTVSASVGTGLNAVAQIRMGQVTGFTIVSGGTLMTGVPQVVISAPDSDALPTVQATATATISGGAVTAITVENPGLGYVTTPTVTLVGGNQAATVNISLMPFGIQGTCIETYQDSIWTANGTKVSFTAPGTTTNFSTSGGGGSFQSTDNFLRQEIVALRQSNGFLYLLADSSINVVSNVQTTVSGSVSTTTFNNSNVDPQVGCSWRDSVVPFGRALVFGNPNGIYALYGGAAQKVSQALDGLFANSAFTNPVPSAAIATIFNIPVYLFNFKTLNPITNAFQTMMAVWDGQKWFTASQVQTQEFIVTQEIGSQLTAWATDFTNVFPMFEINTTSLSKMLQTKLRSAPTHIAEKQFNALYYTATNNAGLASQTLQISVDTEKGNGTLETSANLATSGITAAGWSGPAAPTSATSSYGRYMGLTLETTASDITLILLGVLYSEYSPYAP